MKRKVDRGICYLVGAGPGDPGLLTLKGRQCLERADVVVYDALCNASLLGFAPACAERIFAGKRAGVCKLTQEETNALLVDRTKAGKVVVRLKGGDPFLFGRGGEEAEALAKARLAFEVIPGVTSAIAAPAYAGIPVTHRADSSVVTIFTGHEYPEKVGSRVDYAAIAKATGTKVLLMGAERIAEIAERLQAEGMDGETPVAATRWATTGEQKTLVGKLSTIAELVRRHAFRAPAVFVFGDVVRLRESLNWYETLPLFGQRIAVTRTTSQSGSLVDALRGLGADAFELPTIRIEPPADTRTFIELVADAHGYDWLIFSSANGVRAFFEAFFGVYKDARSLGGVRIAAVGPATADAVRGFRFDVDLVPPKYVAEELATALASETSLDNLRLLIVRPEVARDVLAERLTAAGAIVDEAVAYRTVPETDGGSGGAQRLSKSGADWVTFTSASTAENFAMLGMDLPDGVRTASIGPVTSSALQKLGMRVDVEAKAHDIPGLVAAIVEQVNLDRGRP